MSKLDDIIKAEIALRGPMPFARFMELALYCPEYGFYERESNTVGRGGDFYTSVSVGVLFGELLAFQFADWLAKLSGERLQIVEAGAHDGKLAADILRWLAEHRGELFRRVEYVFVEPSTRRRGWQQETLRKFGQKVRWLDTELAASASEFNGIIFANELLDAMPVRRIGWDAKAQSWFEWGVTSSEQKFVWQRMPEEMITPELRVLPPELLAVLPDGFTTEICPSAEKWWTEAAKSLRSGWLLTFDYGLVAEEFFTPKRAQGTLRAYRRHRNDGDVLSEPGTQDLTAHVNFSQVQKAGEATGLTTSMFTTQSEFIMGVAQRFWPEAQQAGRWSSKQARELQTLMHPEHLGRAFRVLVQTRGVAAGLTDKPVGHLA
ncbi:MAG: SAM-dependent methyltransferase [Verrucomicrobiota bacterium]